jgi:hypothetical protein
MLQQQAMDVGELVRLLGRERGANGVGLGRVIGIAKKLGRAHGRQTRIGWLRRY